MRFIDLDTGYYPFFNLNCVSRSLVLISNYVNKSNVIYQGQCAYLIISCMDRHLKKLNMKINKFLKIY